MEASGNSCQPGVDGDLFPHERARKGQDQFLEDARSCFASRTHLLAHAPTGLGKTAVSLAAGMERALESEGSLYFLTSRHSQHVAAVECLRHIWKRRRLSAVDIVAREAMCLARRKGGRSPCSEGSMCYFKGARIEEAATRLLSYPLHVQEAVGMCLRLGACPYLSAMRALARADAVVCDYNHVFTWDGEGLLGRASRERDRALLVVDEAHNLPTRIMDNHSVELSERGIASASSDPRLKPFRSDLEVLRESFQVLARAGERKHLEAWELDEALQRGCGTDSAGLGEEMVRRLRGEEQGRAKELVAFLRLWSAFGKGSARLLRAAPARLVCRMLEPSLVAAPVLERVRCALLMSGTMHPPEMFAELLGISEGCACRVYPSPFPSENRMVRAVAGVSSRYLQRSEGMYATIARHLGDICRHTPGNLAAFFPSYEFMGAVLFQLRRAPLAKGLLLDGKELSKNEREAMLLEMRREGERALFASIGGSFTEGVDFHDNLLSAVVVVGVPLAPPSLELDALVSRYAERYGPAKARLYAQTYPAVAKVLQAAGRAIRSESDRAAIVLLDERYLLPPISLCLPEEHRPRLSPDLGKELDAFFGATCDAPS